MNKALRLTCHGHTLHQNLIVLLSCRLEVFTINGKALLYIHIKLQFKVCLTVLFVITYNHGAKVIHLPNTCKRFNVYYHFINTF